MKTFRRIRSVRGAAVCTALEMLPLIFCGLSRTVPPFMLWGLFAVLFISPLVICAGFYIGGGAVSMAGLVSGVGAWGLIFGPLGAVAGTVGLGIPLAVYLIVSERNIPFYKSTLAMILAYAAGTLSMLGILVLASPGGDMFTYAADSTVSVLREMGTEGDLMLIVMNNMGLIGEAPVATTGVDGMINTALLGLEEAQRDALLSEVRTLVAQMLLTMIPSYLVGNSMYAGVFSIAVGQHTARKSRMKRGVTAEEEPLPCMDMPHFRQWYIPRGWGLAIALLAVGYLFERLFTTTPGMLVCSIVFTTVFTTAYTIQGAAALNFIQHARHTGVWRRVMPVLLAIMLPYALILLGLFDQYKDFRGLRAPLRERKEV